MLHMHELNISAVDLEEPAPRLRTDQSTDEDEPVGVGRRRRKFQRGVNWASDSEEEGEEAINICDADDVI